MGQDVPPAMTSVIPEGSEPSLKQEVDAPETLSEAPLIPFDAAHKGIHDPTNRKFRI
jgi:hypothetical protein